MWRLCFIGLIWFVAGQLVCQPKYNYNWYFGNMAAIDFNSVPAASRTDNKMSTYRSSASVSDPETGQLLMYTNGNSFWNRFGEMIDINYQGLPVQDVIIIPLKQYKNRFMVFNFSDYYIIDMQARGGRGAILEKRPFVLRTSINRMTAVKHCLSESYWLITIDGNAFCSYLVHPNGVIDIPVVSTHPTLQTSTNIGDFVSSNNGEKLALTCYTPANPSTMTFYEPQIFDFDKRCGTVGPGRVTLPMLQEWNMPHGIAFSPDDQLIYVAYGYMESQLVQYRVNGPNTYFVVAASPQNFNQIACGPDGRLYITTHIDNIPSNKLDAVLYPNTWGNGCNYRQDHMRLSGVTNFEVPNMIVCHTGTCKENKGFQLVVDEGACVNQPVHFEIKGQQSGMDSIRWNFNDPLGTGKYDNRFTTTHTYSLPGTYRPCLLMYFCGHADSFFFDVLITAPQRFSLGNDTTLCHGDSLKIGHTLPNGSYQWNTGADKSFIVVYQPGTYRLDIDRKGCKSADTIVIGYYPSLELLLGDAYYICEEEKELVQLDAGKGFKTYLWYPTSDTTQWIEVGKRGNYYVVVKDYRGCRGNDASIVESRCDLRVFIPNAFSPNGDGLNDVLKIATYNETSVRMQVYTGWGELIYEGDGDWDGLYKGQLVMQGIYLVRLEIKGFINKKPVSKAYSTTVQVLY
jgi:gliding motility-associated-like protein